MRITRFALVALASLALVAPYVLGQDQPASTKSASPILKVQVIIAEQEGEKKVANLPYTFFLRAPDNPSGNQWTKLRMGSRVPVYSGKDSFQYIDVGTSIDARALAIPDGHFDISLNLERSWVEGEVLIPPAATGPDSNAPQHREPVIRQFKTELAFTMQDGQSIQSTQASDPVSGRVLTLTVTMNVMK